MTSEDTEAEKRAAAEAAVGEVGRGMLVGLGTGSTAAYAIAAVGRSGLAIRAVATSDRTAAAARAAGIMVVEMAGVTAIDLAIDGVDEIDPTFRAIKGAGGAMLREKVVATAARRMVAIADASKAVARLGGRPVPVEVLPFAAGLVAARVEALGAEVAMRRVEPLHSIPREPVEGRATGAAPAARPSTSLRTNGEEAATLVRTDNGNLILDCRFAALADPERLDAQLSAIPGLLGHGLFVREIDALYLGTATGVERTDKAA